MSWSRRSCSRSRVLALKYVSVPPFCDFTHRGAPSSCGLEAIKLLAPAGTRRREERSFGLLFLWELAVPGSVSTKCTQVPASVPRATLWRPPLAVDAAAPHETGIYRPAGETFQKNSGPDQQLCMSQQGCRNLFLSQELCYLPVHTAVHLGCVPVFLRLLVLK